MEFITHGFPQKIGKSLSHLHGFWNFRDELSIENGIILKSHKILIPSSIQCKILELIHKGHLGMESVSTVLEIMYTGKEFPMTSGNLWTSVLYVRKLEPPTESFHSP